MLEIFSKIVEKYDQNFFFRPISMNIFLGTNQTILNFFFFTFKKKKVFDEKMFVDFSKKNFLKFFFSIFFFCGGLRPWTPRAFVLRTLVGTGSCSTAYQKKIWTFFFLKSKNFYFLKWSELYPKTFHRNRFNFFLPHFHFLQPKKI